MRTLRFGADGAAQRGGDQTGRQDSRRHLVEQGLEEVVVRAIDECYLEARAVESVDRVQAPEPAAHDDDLMAVGHCLPPRPVLQFVFDDRALASRIASRPASNSVPTNVVLNIPIIVSGSPVRESADPLPGNRNHSLRWPG